MNSCETEIETEAKQTHRLEKVLMEGCEAGGLESRTSERNCRNKSSEGEAAATLTWCWGLITTCKKAFQKKIQEEMVRNTLKLEGELIKNSFKNSLEIDLKS